MNKETLQLTLNINNKNYTVFSDLHIFHNNIFDYEQVSRQKINDVLGIKEFSWYEFSKRFIDNINNNYPIINLWDFLFHLWEEKLANNKDTIQLWEKLSNKMIVILWNHDLNKNHKLNSIEYNIDWDIFSRPNASIFQLFNIKVFHVLEDKNTIFIFTHYPIWYFDIEHNDRFPFFEKLDKFIQEKYINNNNNKKIVNIHGHTHSVRFDWLENISYVNVCIDSLVKNTEPENWKTIVNFWNWVDAKDVLNSLEENKHNFL